MACDCGTSSCVQQYTQPKLEGREQTLQLKSPYRRSIVRCVHAAFRVANDGTLARGTVSSIGSVLCDGDGGGRVKRLGMMLSCSLMANGLRPFKNSSKKSYSVSRGEVDFCPACVAAWLKVKVWEVEK